MLFIHFSTDRILLSTPSQEVVLPFDELERVLPMTVWTLWSEKKSADFIVINSPGSFTSLRIGCLTLNSLQMLEAGKLRFWNRSKIELYALLVNQGVLPSVGIIHIGQKKKVRLYDFSAKTYSYLRVDEPFQLPETYFADMMFDHAMLAAIDPAKKITFQYNHVDEVLMVDYAHAQFSISGTDLMTHSHSYTYLEPMYMIDPQIGAPVTTQ